MSWRRVQVLVAGLPPEAAVFRTVEGMGGWTVSDHLLAAAVDAIGVTAYNALVGPHVDPRKLRKVKPPEPIPRPGTHAARPRKRMATADDMRRLFGADVQYRPKEVN